MRTKRWFALFFAAALAASVLAGCQWPPDGGEDGSSSSSSSSSRPSSDDDDSGSEDKPDKPVTYTVTASIGEGGTVTIDGTPIESGSYSVQEGTVLTFTVQPNKGYQIGAVTANGDELTGQDGAYTYTVNSNCTIAVSFKYIPKTFTMSVTADPSEGGSLAYTETATEGENWTLTITPTPGYMVGSVTDNGTEVTDQVDDNVYTIENIAESHTIVVTFTSTIDPTIDPTDPATWQVTDEGVIIVPAGADSDLINYTLFDNYYPNATGLDLTGSDVTSIGGLAFISCTNLQTVDMGSVKTINSAAFVDCTNLTNVDMGSVTRIDDNAFFGCPKLTNVDMSSVQTIDNYAFAGCTNLTNVDMGSVTSIGASAFQNCTSLTNIRLGSVLPTTVLSGAFSGAGSSAGTITIYSDALMDDESQQTTVRNWFDYLKRVEFRSSSEYPGAAAGNALAQYLTRLF